MIMNLETNIENLKGVGEKTKDLFNKLGIFTLDDLVHYYPRSYDQYQKVTGICDAIQNNVNAVYATVKSNPKLLRLNGKSIISFYITDGEASCEVKYFNASYILKTVKIGDKKVFRGLLRTFRDKLTLEHPRIYSLEDYRLLENTIYPIYPLTKDLSNDRLSKTVRKVLEGCSFKSDYLLEKETDSFDMLPIDKAAFAIHFPKDEVEQYKARRRIVFEEFLQFVKISKEGSKESTNLPNNFKMLPVADCRLLEEKLPFTLTNAQKRAIEDIFTDMESPFLMNRCVQGDVGSGKTIVAIMALLKNAANGYQGALMAPTEVLARQHYENIRELSEKYNLCIKPVLLVGKQSAKIRKEILSDISNGICNVVVGTQALIQEGVEFKNLSLVITDEQHRFGVKQREELQNKGVRPHILVMSATPIPRSLAMILFAGLSVSIIDELPKNRIPISNCVVNSGFREKIYEKMRSEIQKGHQVYVICPMVDENDEDILGLKSVKEHAEELKEYFGDKYRILSLNGKMRPAEKISVMDNFKAHNADILVSTTVIEVGVDVPNATLMVIENAERFGLAQLHQLRGRVGRGKDPSFCIFVSDTKKEETLKRLNILNETNDGFKIAEKDMELRGPGELNGIRQSGELQFGIGDVSADSDILLLATTNYDRLKERIPDETLRFIDFRTI